MQGPAGTNQSATGGIWIRNIEPSLIRLSVMFSIDFGGRFKSQNFNPIRTS